MIQSLSVNASAIVIALFLVIVGLLASPASAQEFKEPEYVIRGGEVLGFKIDSEARSIIISLQARTNGELIITLPRDLIDAKTGDEDTDFITIIDGLELHFFEETITSSDRTLTIPFGKFNSEIIIIGTQLFSQPAPLPTVIPQQIENKIKAELASEIPEGKAKLLVFSDTSWSGAIQATGFDYTEMNGRNDRNFIFECQNFLWREGVFGAKFEKTTQDGYLKLVMIQNQKILEQRSTQAEFGSVIVSGNCVSNFGGGGCLIATATFGSELAPQVQELREIRDKMVLNTRSGAAFITGFNQLYYSFSPTIADWERQNPVFKEFVKVAITPLITTLSILQYVDIDSEEEMLGYGIGIILLNVGMYFVVPAILIMKLKKKI
ncbi:MAG: CFI-box-CTERM domain-containing protein [Nitrosopumilaceae archaeon]